MIYKVLFPILLSVLALHASCQDAADDLAAGDCYAKEGNLNLAQAAYERLLFYDNSNTQAKLKLISLYRKEGMQKDANLLLATIDERTLTPQQRTTLAALHDKHKEKGRFRAQMTLDLGYDDNININHVYDTLTLASDAQGTRYLRFNADLSYQHDLSDSNGWFLRSDANIYHQYNFDFESDLGSHYYDTLYGRLYAGGGYSTRNLSIYLPLFYDRMNYLNVDLFSEIGTRPDFNMMFADMFVLNINSLLSKRDYIQTPDKMRDDYIATFESGFYWIQEKNNAYLKVRYEKYIPQDDNAVPVGTKVFVDKSLASLTLGGLYSIASILDIRAQFLFRKGDFKEIPLFFGSLKRDDTTKELQLSFERELSHSLKAHIQLHYLDNSSNYNQADFTKHEALVGLVYDY